MSDLPLIRNCVGCGNPVEEDDLVLVDGQCTRCREARLHASLPDSTPHFIAQSVDAYLLRKGWEHCESNTVINGKPVKRMLYKSPRTGYYHPLSTAMGLQLEAEGVKAT